MTCVKKKPQDLEMYLFNEFKFLLLQFLQK